ncbi:MAG: protein kinase [Planctomycetes bacterium]|nr:protein kinase [Planctomycetota bacterium]
MSAAEAKNGKRRHDEEVPPTASFGAEGRGPGGKIGQFRIESELGRGGMGVVYLAHDTKLDRQVAIKSLPAELMDNPKARSRFSREARVLASLNHPNIATIYDELKEAEGAGYLVLEYVPGDTLAERIGRKRLKVKEALTIGLQIAEGVAAAHEKGIIHRDLKAGNIKITPEGKVKVLDFGLAKAVGGETLNQQSTITEPGRIIGTPAYMSPEQARGEAADERSDIWSFGCVLYEMLTGRVPFEGATPSDTLANILQIEPDWQALSADTPENIRVLLRRCLEKDVHQRLQHIGDARIEISETLNLPATAPPVTTPSSASFKSEIAAKAKSRRMAMIIGAAIVIIVLVIASRFLPDRLAQPSSKLIRVVVLPFDNLGPAEDEYFSDGITDAITARLAGIGGLGVISRQSAMQYKKREKSARVIGKELGVDYILEGTVQRERPSDPNSRVRIIPQLIRVRDDTHVWAETYDNDMSEVFRVQSDVAEQVAQALDITLLKPERLALASEPTKNLEAWDYYLRGNEYFHRSFEKSDYSIAIQMFDRAVELDTRFALAYAQLSRAHLYMYWLFYDHTEERLAMAKGALDKVLELAPDLLEAHLALGHYYYHGHMDYDRALDQFEIARKRQPNNSEVTTFIGYVQRRQGKFQEAVVTLKRASELNPLSNLLAGGVGATFMVLRKYAEAERYFERSISLAPDAPGAYNGKAWLYLRWDGSTKRARAVLAEAVQNIKLAENAPIINTLVNIDVFDGNYQEALDRLSLKSEDIDDHDYFIPNALRYALIYGYMNNKEPAKKYYEEARSILESKFEEQPEDARFHSSLGIAYAGLGRKEDALREGKLAVELLPVSKEAWRGLHPVEALAQIYAMVGEFDAAIEKLEYLLSIPSETSIPLLRLDPTWAPLRDHRRFKKLLEEGK